MSAVVRIANLPPGTTVDEVEAMLRAIGMHEGHSVALATGEHDSTAMVTVSWSAAVAESVARHFDGRQWNGRTLRVHALSMFHD